MSVQMTAAVIGAGPRDRTQFNILAALANYADEYGFCFPQLETLAKDARYDVRSVRRTVDELESHGWIWVGRKRLNGKSNVYILNAARMGVTVSPDKAKNPVFMRLSRMYRDMVSPVFREGKEPVEMAVDESIPTHRSFFGLGESGDTDGFSEDNPQGVQGTNEGGSEDKLCPPNRYNHHGTVSEEKLSLPSLREGDDEERVPDEVLQGNTATTAESWGRFRETLKRTIGVRANPNFTRIVPEECDYDACFRDWVLLRVERRGLLWTFVTDGLYGEQCELTRLGIEKYGGRLASTAKAIFPVPRAADVRFVVSVPVAGRAA